MTRPTPTKEFFLSNNNLPIFKSELTNGIELRILGLHDDPWFIAKDIAAMLEYKNTEKAVRDHVDNDYILTYENYKKSRLNEMSCLKNDCRPNETRGLKIQDTTKLINKSGLYCLILRSKNEKAKLFQKWITTEVLPSITTQQNKTNFEQSTDIIELKLTLKNNRELYIPVSKDGYVNVTKLCKAGGKEYKHWKENKESEAVIKAIERSVGIPTDLIIRDIRTGKNESRGTFVHRRLALIIAQWISPDFAVQVADWTEELLLFGSVTLGQEKSNKELDNKFLEQINQLTNENKELTDKYDKLRNLHNSLKFKRNYHQLEVGDCVYVCHNKLEPPNRFKIGKTNNINKTLKVYRRISPYMFLDFLFFTTKMSLLEDILLTKYQDERRPVNHELIEDIEIETIIADIKTIISLIKIPGSAGSAESIDMYNKDINTPNINAYIVESDDEKDEEDEQNEINIFIENRVDFLEKEVDLIDEKIEMIEEDIAIVDESLAKVEARVQVIEQTQNQEYMTLFKEMENYTNKKLKEWLIRLKLPVSGNKYLKKQKITDHLKKSSIVLENIDYREFRECNTCKENKLLNNENYRNFGYGYKNRCIICDLKSCETILKLREDINTAITNTTKTATCSKCKNVVAIDDFYKNKSNSNGRHSQCKNCTAKGTNIRNNDGVLKPMRKINRKVICDDNKKHCIECDTIKSKEEFRKSSARNDGCQVYCKICDNKILAKNRMLKKIKSNL
jgi:prophage antirepressor-like protein